MNDLTAESTFQFERKGFFCVDKDSDIANGKIIFNETVGLVDRTAKKWLHNSHNNLCVDMYRL